MFEIVHTKVAHAQEIVELMAKNKLPFWSEQSIINECDKENAIILSALYGDKIVGFISVGTCLDEAEINNIAVDDHVKRSGLGTKLVLETVKICRGKNIKTLMLDVRKSNDRAIKFYEKMGFYAVGERKNFYENPPENALLFNLNLD